MSGAGKAGEEFPAEEHLLTEEEEDQVRLRKLNAIVVARLRFFDVVHLRTGKFGLGFSPADALQ